MSRFLSQVVVDANGEPLAGAIGQIFAVADELNATPLPLFDNTGAAVPLNQLVANNDGVTPDFNTPGNPVVKWVSGSHVVGMISWDIVPKGGLPSQVLSKITGADFDFAWTDPLDGLPPGGLDGQALVKSGTADFATRWGSSGRWENVRTHFSTFRIEGVDDDRPAFESARLTGRPVYAPAGDYYVSSSPAWGDYSICVGDGKERTTIKLLDTAPADVTLWCNADLSGNTYGYFADFTLDGNCQRQGGTLVGAGGSRSSCFALRNAHHFYVERVSAINAVQHGFDITRGSLDYAYAGDGVVATLRSSDVYLDLCDASNFGDDGFTTHHSDNVHISRSISSNPRRRENCNGFEIDGDSRNCTLTGNRSYGCYAGVEIKGHGTESAAQLVIINGHIDEESVRSYNFRHIGYHSGTDPVSLTAEGIIASGLISINPNNDRGFQDTATARALSISAYHGVKVTGLIATGRGTYGAGDIAIAVQFRSGHVNLTGVDVSGWNGADVDLSITTGDNVTVTGFSSRNSANKAIYTGANVTAAQFFGLNLTGPVGGTNGLDIYNSDGVTIAGLSVTGYTVPLRADLTDYPTAEHFFRRARSLPAGITRLVDLPPTTDYYLTTAEYATMTDRPTGTTGGYWVRHSRTSSDSVIQTLTRNTSNAANQATYERIAYYITDTATPWILMGTGGAAGAPTWETVPARTAGVVLYMAASSAYEARPTARTDVSFRWYGPVAPTTTIGFVEGIDFWENVPV